MKRFLQVGVMLLVGAARLLLAEQAPAKPGKAGVIPRPPAAVKAPKAPNAPRLPNAPRKLNDPGASVAQRLMQMTPEQRERALEKFPLARQAEIRQRLQRLDNLPPQQQQRMIQQYQMYSSLPPEKQILVRRQIQAFNQLPEERRQALGPELQKLRRMPEDEREAHLASEDFKSKFSPAEQQMLSDISENMPTR
jgi:Protein of unknown function (DUF3106)